MESILQNCFGEYNAFIMNPPVIYILTAPIHTGKTTSLLQWSAGRNNVYGIFTPDINGKRVFMNASTREQFPMETIDDNEPVLEIGRFRFSAVSFNKAGQILADALQQTSGYLVIDEIGPLELRKEGLYDAVKTILQKNDRLKIILVVREKLVDEIVSFFSLKDPVVITINSLKELG